jgi:lysophospholipase L1-like esterase
MRMRRLLSALCVNGLLVLGSLALCFVGAELFLRAHAALSKPSTVAVTAPAQPPPALDPNGEIQVPAELLARQAARHALLTMPDEWKMAKIVVPGAYDAFTWHGVVHPLNTVGMRWASPFPEKNPETYRVLVVGDSLTYGVGIAEQDTFTALLNRWMDRDYRIEFLNLGSSGSQSEDILKTIKTFVPQLRPNLVIYAVCLNDFLPSGQGEYTYTYAFPLPGNLQRFFLTYTRTGPFISELYDRTLRYFHLRRDFFDDILSGFGGYEDRFRRDVAEMNSFVRAAGLPPMIAMIIDQYPAAEGRRHRIVSAAERALRDGNFDLMSLDDFSRRYHGKSMNVSRWEGHPDEVANFIWATMFMRKLQERLDIQAFKRSP